jgi:hypothetical protein
MYTECLSVADDSLFNEFKTKTEICNATKEVQLSGSTVTVRVDYIRMSDDIEQQPR